MEREEESDLEPSYEDDLVDAMDEGGTVQKSVSIL